MNKLSASDILSANIALQYISRDICCSMRILDPGYRPIHMSDGAYCYIFINQHVCTCAGGEYECNCTRYERIANLSSLEGILSDFILQDVLPEGIIATVESLALWGAMLLLEDPSLV